MHDESSDAQDVNLAQMHLVLDQLDVEPSVVSGLNLSCPRYRITTDPYHLIARQDEAPKR